MDKRMAILDLDMTLLDGNGSLPPSTKETLDRMIERDIKVVIASGRRWSKIKPCLGSWIPNAPVISSNGSVIIDPAAEEPISVETISMDTAAEVISFAHQGGMCLLYLSDPTSDGRIYRDTDPIDPEGFGLSFISVDSWMHAVVDDLSQLTMPASKLLIVSQPPETTARALSERLDRLSLPSKLYWYKEPLIEVLSPMSSKALAAEKVARMYGLTRENTVAFGDETNDLEVLRWAGLSIAMDHAPAGVKAACHKSIPWDFGEGVNKALKQLFLNEPD